MTTTGIPQRNLRALLIALAIVLGLLAAGPAAAAANPTLTVTPAGNGAGTVTSTPAGIDCGSTCSTSSFPAGTSVTLTATPASGSQFASWSGPCTGTGPCTFTLNADTTVLATFTRPTLAVTKGGTGKGTVTSSPAGIDCGATCTAAFDQNTQVTLTATRAVGSRFSGWSGNCTGTASTCTLTMDASKAVAANFIATPTLKVDRTGTGGGFVTSSPAGISCGASCAATYDQSTKVTLTATPAAGSKFAGWAGGGCAGTRQCKLTLTQTTQVSARFNAQIALNVVKNGTGSGNVTSAPRGINCGVTCAASYALGTKVKLSAKASPGSRFAGWSGGGCSGTRSCVVTLLQAQSVTATFDTRTAAPNTHITRLHTHRRPHRRGRARVWFTGSGGTGGLTFKCKIDRRRYRPCRSPKRFRHLRKGRHTIRVKAIDSQGVADPTPARIGFKL
jgi:hypothetical protein